MTPTPVSIESCVLPRPEVAALAPALASLVGGRVSSSSLDRLAVARDQSALATAWDRQGLVAQPADLVVWPSSDDEVAAVIRFAREHRLAVIPFGAGSGRVGGTAAFTGGVCLDLKRLDAISPVDARERTVRVGAGVLGATLERRLAARGWTTGQTPTSLSMSTIGGWLATREVGQTASRYGSIDDAIVSVSGVFGTGERFETPKRPFAGLDLARLLIGSEGTLAVFTSAVLRVMPVPEARAFRTFDVASLEQGLELVRGLWSAGLRPSIVRVTEKLDETLRVPSTGFGEKLRATIAGALFKRPSLASPLSRLANSARVVVVFEGLERHVQVEAHAALAAALSRGAVDAGEVHAREWFHRRFDDVFHAGPLVLRDGVVLDVLNVFAPWSVASSLIARVRAATESEAVVRVAMHDARVDGCGLHFTFAVPADAQVLDRVARAANGAVALEGSRVQFRQGIGALRAKTFHDGLQSARLALAALKRHFDPDGVLNPGKLSL